MRALGGGSVVNMGSVMSVLGSDQSAAYAVAKHGVVGLTRTASALDEIVVIRSRPVPLDVGAGRLRGTAVELHPAMHADHRPADVRRQRAERRAGRAEPQLLLPALVDVWLADLDLEDKIAPSTRALYERHMETLVLPSFEQFALREIRVRKVDQFLKTLAKTGSYGMTKQARTVLSLAFGPAGRRAPEVGSGWSRTRRGRLRRSSGLPVLKVSRSSFCERCHRQHARIGCRTATPSTPTWPTPSSTSTRCRGAPTAPGVHAELRLVRVGRKGDPGSQTTTQLRRLRCW
jgi:hypothetical protein